MVPLFLFFVAISFAFTVVTTAPNQAAACVGPCNCYDLVKDCLGAWRDATHCAGGQCNVDYPVGCRAPDCDPPN